MIVEISVFSVSGEMFGVTGQTGLRQYRVFYRRGPAAANDRSPTVKSRDGRTSRRLEVDERSPAREDSVVVAETSSQVSNSRQSD